MIRIKICGVTNRSDAGALSELDIDFYGLNFIRTSPRYVDPFTAWEISQHDMPLSVPVGLFDLSDPAVSSTSVIENLGLRVVQLYQHAEMKHNFRGISRLEIIRISDSNDMMIMKNEADIWRSRPETRPFALVIDSHSEHALGGTGHVAPWDLIAGFDPGVPVILAGGLTPENVAEAIRIVKPWGVDVASGVEKSPGVKDLKKVRAFIDAARAAASAL